MPAQVWTTGPARICVGTGNAGALEFLGRSEGPVRIVSNVSWRDIHVDQYGEELAYDVQWMGETENIISCELAKWDGLVYNRLQNWLASALFTGGGGTSGSAPANSIGTIMGLEQASIRLLIYAENSAKSVYTNMFTGTRNYPRAMMIGPQEAPITTRNQTIRTIFRATPVPGGTPPGSDGSYLLWNVDTTGMPAGG